MRRNRDELHRQIYIFFASEATYMKYSGIQYFLFSLSYFIDILREVVKINEIDSRFDKIEKINDIQSLI